MSRYLNRAAREYLMDCCSERIPFGGMGRFPQLHGERLALLQARANHRAMVRGRERRALREGRKP